MKKKKKIMIGVSVTPETKAYLTARSNDGTSANVSRFVRAMIERDRTAWTAAQTIKGGKNGR